MWLTKTLNENCYIFVRAQQLEIIRVPMFERVTCDRHANSLQLTA